MSIVKLLNARALVSIVLILILFWIALVAVKDSYYETDRAQYPWGNTVNEYHSENECWTGVKRLSDAGAYERSKLDCIEHKVKYGNTVWLLTERR